MPKRSPRPSVAAANRRRQPSVKACPDCGVDVLHKSGPIPRCPSCAATRRDAVNRRFAQGKGKEYWRAVQRRHYYGIEPEQYEAMFESQGRRCAVCRTDHPGTKDWCVDHDHACCPGSRKACGRCVRGILCDHCNVAASRVKDDPAIALALAAYLSR